MVSLPILQQFRQMILLLFSILQKVEGQLYSSLLFLFNNLFIVYHYFLKQYKSS